MRKNKLQNIEGQLAERQEAEFAGLQADTQLADYQRRSLPSDPQLAQAQYKEWLEQLVGQSGLQNRVVDYVNNQASGNLYRTYTFRVAGTGNAKQIADLSAAFHQQHYLHRSKKIVVRPADDRGNLSINMDVEALAMNAATAEQPPPSQNDPRTEGRREELVTAVARRNLFFPANRPPRYTGGKTLTAYIDRDFLERLRFEDPDDGNQVDIQVDESTLPPGLQFSKGQLIGRAKEKGEFTLRVIATDSGLSQAVTEQLVSIKVTDAPPKPEPPAEPPPYDESQQAVLTGLVQSRGTWRAWIHIRTQNKLLKLAVGDSFEVGNVSGKIVDVNDRFVVFESEGKTLKLHQDKSLADAVEG